ncbi:efflux RND transporter periplasmic adaptor subunit [Allochromatium palmeri]|uniref:Efflux RND transporter periplasmic adaptor subunit n=1 Tax=Allochromatium palmeri TaxID=231048 RepID=A0A6N8E6A7_9GAMM|nr:efflux RND transporter periplasmic adaptor subunit [Allochromatium palmeri]MTW19743.1 efflux RND transporter periplasmic adaptor subunit [Allochromatium palmeri]
MSTQTAMLERRISPARLSLRLGFPPPILTSVRRLQVAVLGVALVLALSACEPAKPTATQREMPPPSVIAVAAETKTIEQEASFVGRVVAVNRVELRARVEGFLKERLFKEGQTVAVGDVLFMIEPDQYEAVVEQRAADLEKAKADSQNADAQLARGLELLKQKNIAQAKVDELQAAAAVAKASIAQAQAALNAARLDLSYTQITAPIAGRVGLSSLSVGNMVGPSSGVLATLVSRDPIHVQFPVTQRDLLAARQQIAAKGGDPRQVVIQVRLPNGQLYAQSGHLDFVDVTTDQTTDSVTLRAELPNPDGTLVDGQYVGVVVQSGTPESAILIPQAALQIDQQGLYVLIVDTESKAQVRRVKTGQSRGAEIVITQGLAAGELVISEGVQGVTPGQPVKAVPPQSVKAETQP